MINLCIYRDQQRYGKHCRECLIKNDCKSIVVVTPEPGNRKRIVCAGNNAAEQ